METFFIGFLSGVISIIAIGIFIWTIKRKGGHNKNGISDAIKREGEFQERLDDTGRELSEDVGSARDRTSERFDNARDEIRSKDSPTDTSVRITDRIASDLKKRNNLE